MLKKLGLGLLALLVLLVLVLAVNTWRQTSRQIRVQPLPWLSLDENAAALRLAAAVQLKTVSSRTDAQLNADQFQALHALLKKLFPNVSAALQREALDDGSLLYTWGGTDPTAAPILLLAHLDVAPVAPGTEGEWRVPPFSGEVKDGAVWGRGTWDDKGNLMAQLEAIDLLIAKGYKPRRTVYLAYGADAEAGGQRGAARIAALLLQRGIHPAFVLGNGLPLLDGVVPGLRAPVALVGVAGTGSASVALRVTAPAGAPQSDGGAAALLQRALAGLHAPPVAAEPAGLRSDTLAALAPDAHGALRVGLANRWLFGPWLRREFRGVPGIDAAWPSARVTPATAAKGAPPDSAAATVTLQLLPGKTPEAALERLRQRVSKVVPAGRFELALLPGAREPSAVTPVGSAPYQALARTIREVFPDAVVAPARAPATDAAYYGALSDHVLRFSPLRAGPADMRRLHGMDGHLGIADYANAVRFYHRLIPALEDAPGLSDH